MAYKDLTYCTVEDIKKITAIVNAIDGEYIEPFLLSAEEMHIYPVLGDALNTELLNEVEQGILSGSNELLVINYIVPASAWYSFYDGVPFLSMKLTNKGLNQAFSDSSSPVDIDRHKMYSQNVKDKAIFYLNRLRTFLNENANDYPNYRSDDCNYSNRSWSSGIWL